MFRGRDPWPVKTAIRLPHHSTDEVQQGKTKGFDDGAAGVESQLRRDRATDRFGETQERLQSKLEQPGADLNVLTKESTCRQGRWRSSCAALAARRSGRRSRCRIWCLVIRR